MKTLTEYLNNDETYEINEAVDGETIALLISEIAILTSFICMGSAMSTYYGDNTIPEIISNWWKDHKAKGIAKKLAQDSEVQEFLQLPVSKQRGGWQKLLKTKLDEKDYQYIYKISKNCVKDKIK